MKKICLLLSVLLCLTFTINAQLPYSKLMNLTTEQLVEKNFKYVESKNQYVLTKTDAGNVTLGVLSALSGAATTYAPSKKDYKIILQYGQDGLSSLTAIFYSDDTFNEIQTWLAENNIQSTSSASGKISILKFNYDSLHVELRTAAVIQSSGSSTRSRYSTSSNSIDNSYTIYTYTIETGIPPFSVWHTKAQKKKDADAAKGKKEDINDLL
jgi:hypothetical protein